MAIERMQFDWHVCPAGYRWVQATAVATPGEEYRPLKGPQPALVPADPTNWETESSPSPEPEPALFRIFAGVKPDKEGILAFANRYGNLGGGVECQPAKRDVATEEAPLHGTLMSVWRNQISAVRRLVGLWDLLRAQDRGRLAQHFRWSKEGAAGPAVYFVSHPRGGEGEDLSLGVYKTRGLVASREHRPEMLAAFEVGDPVLPGWLYLQEDLDLHLFHTTDEIGTTMAWDTERQRPTMQLVAPTLLSAVWVQLADAVSNDRTFSRCRMCGKWFEVAPDVARSHRRFCSNACKTRAHRNKQDRARQLYTTEKKTFEEIADELDSDAATVRRWITGIRE
jgi:hypothetical protein